MSNLPIPKRGVFCISIVDIILRSSLVVFILLDKSNYHHNKGPFWYVLPLYSHYCYSELSINYYSGYRKIYLCRYICCCWPLAYNDSVIHIVFYFKMSRNFAFLTNIESIHLCYLWTQIFRRWQRKSLPLIFIIKNKCRNQAPVIKLSFHWNTDHYQGLADQFEGYLDSDLNRLTSSNLHKYTTVPSQCESLPCTWTWHLLYLDH